MEKGLGHLFISSTSSNFFNKTDFEQYLFEKAKICIRQAFGRAGPFYRSTTVSLPVKE